METESPSSLSSPSPSPSPPVRLDTLPELGRYWRLKYALLLALPGAALLLLHLLLSLRRSASDRPLLLAIGLALLALGALAGWFYGTRRHALYRAELRAGEGVVLYSGVWWRSEVWVPMARLQHLDVSQGPLDRRWAMASLSLHTAGSHDHHTRIDGLPQALAHSLRERLLPRQRGEHD